MIKTMLYIVSMVAFLRGLHISNVVSSGLYCDQLLFVFGC